MAPRNAPNSAPTDSSAAANGSDAVAADANATSDAPVVNAVANDYGGFAIAPGPGVATYRKDGIELLVKTN